MESGTNFKSVSAEALKAECLRLRYAGLLVKPEVFPSENNWEYIISNRMEGLGQILYRKYLVSVLMPEKDRSIYHTVTLREFPRYIKAVSRDHALETVYGDTTSDRESFVKLVYDCDLFDAGRILAIARGGDVALAVDLLKAFQPEYTHDDEVAMRRLHAFLTSLPELGRIETRRGLLGLERRYVCPAGHSNRPDGGYCSHEDCRLDIYGLTPEQNESIGEFGTRIDALAGLL